MNPKQRNFGIGIAACLLGVGLAWWWFFGLSRQQAVELINVQGDVKIDGAGIVQPGWQGSAGGREIVAGADGFAAIRLADGSVTQLTPGARLTITKARQSADAKRFVVELKLDAGEVLRNVPPPDAGVKRESNLVTNAAVIGVRGTVYLVRSDGDASRVMVHRGAVAIEGGADAAAIPLSENYGTVAQAAKAPERPSVLLAPPSLTEPQPSQMQSLVQIGFRWQPVPEAREYSLEIARDEQFRDLVLRQRSTAPAHTVAAALPHDARYFWRVASVDARGLTGRGSEPRPLHYKFFHVSGKARIKQSDAKGALDLYHRAETGYARDPALLKDIGWAHYVASDLPKARAYFDRALGIDPTDLEVRIQRGRVLFWLKDFPAAQADYEKVLSVTAADMDAMWGLAEVEIAQGRHREALAHLDQVLAKFPEHEYGLFSAAKAALALDDKERARGLLAREMKLRPGNQAATELYGQLQRKPLPPE